MSEHEGLVPVATDRFVDTRLQVHWAAQVVAGVGQTWVTPAPDESHPNLGASGEPAVLWGRSTATTPALEAGLQIAPLALCLRRADGGVAQRLPLDGCTLDDGRRWMEEQVAAGLGQTRPLARASYEMPGHPVSAGAPFRTTDPEVLIQLGRWFSLADQVLCDVLAGEPHASEPRCWPHHFDLGALISLEPDVSPETARSIGLGLTPGDVGRPAPYFYVNAYPAPSGEALPAFESPGGWNTDGWIGLVLDAEEVVSAPPGEQRDLATSFVRRAVGCCRQLLDA